MDSTRQLKFARLIQKELSDIFLRDAKGLLEGVFITITKVTVTPDLSTARVYVSYMLVKDKEAALKNLSSHTKQIRKLLGDKIRSQARIIPELVFFIDDNLDYASKMDKLISNLEIPPEPEKEKDEEDEED
jgi:ribosome-binding factor A